MKRRREFRIKGERPLIPSSIRVPHCPGPICSLLVRPEKRRGEKDERKERKTSFSCNRVSTNLTTLCSFVFDPVKHHSKSGKIDTIATDFRAKKRVREDRHDRNSRQ